MFDKICYSIIAVLVVANGFYIHKNFFEEKHIIHNEIKQNFNVLPVNEDKPIVKLRTTKSIVTGFNTVPEQTDGNPCNAAHGNICGRNDVVACPTNLKPHTKVIILNKIYECMDRTASKFDGRFDISFDKDIKAAKNFGKRNLDVIIIK